LTTICAIRSPTWTTMTPAEIAEMRERLGNALLELELRRQDVTRLEARNAQLEAALRLEEQHHTIALKDNIVLKKQLAERPKRRGRQADAGDSRNVLS
jgi:hypothetical protein